ncbi:MAG: hypothetical protein HY537_08280 [Deltaproteobacteria bacterium]|nr:hypothetical protein [Deltaproteobacteria bacterium]
MSAVGKLLVTLIAWQSVAVFADTRNSGWNFSQGCASHGTGGSGSFSAEVSGSFTAGGTMGCSRTSSRFTKIYFSSYSGTAAPNSGWYNSTTGQYEIFSLDFGDFMVTPPILSTEKQPIFTVSATCPTATTNVNWITAQWTDTQTTSLQSTYLIGTATITANTGALTITGQYDVNGTTYWSGSVSMNLASCSNGQANSTGHNNLTGTFYYKADGGGVYKSDSGRAFFMLPQASITQSNFGSKTFQGILFNSQASDSVKPIQVTSNAAGTVFTVQPFSDVSAGTVGSAFTDTITITNANSPVNGMMRGTVTRTGTGAGGPTKIACLANRHLTKGLRVICSGQSPNSSTLPYNITFNQEADSSLACPTNYLLVRANPTVGVNSDFCVSKYEMKQGECWDVWDPDTESWLMRYCPKALSAGTPWVSITRDAAISWCQEYATGYDLISNAQWQALARDIELAQDSNGNYLNWSNGAITGSNALNQGHSDSSPGNALAASTDNDPCSGTGNTNCATNSHSDFTQKRTHTLSSGESIWDVAGNVYEWVKDNNSTTQGTNGYLSVKTWDGNQDARETAAARLKWGPSGTYTAKASTPYGGLGYGVLNYSTGTVIRSSDWLDGDLSGVFAAFLYRDASSYSSTTVGFRCVYTPQ